MISELQRTQRQGKIGSSDAAAILGLDPYRSAADVWLQATGQADSFAGNEATERGNLLEPALLTFAAQKLGKAFNPDQMFTHASGMLVANLDAISIDETEAIEAKSTVIEEGWGEPGTDEIPDRVNAQVAHQFAVVPSLRVIWVPVVIPVFRKFDWRLYRVERNDELAGIVEKSGLEFMERFVLPRVQPTDFQPSLDVLKRVRREPNRIVEVPAALLDSYIVANAAKKQAEEDCEAAQAALIAALGTAEAGVTEAGTRCTYFSQKQKRIDTKAFKAARPALAEEFEKEIEFRVLRLPRK